MIVARAAIESGLQKNIKKSGLSPKFGIAPHG